MQNKKKIILLLSLSITLIIIVSSIIIINKNQIFKKEVETRQEQSQKEESAHNNKVINYDADIPEGTREDGRTYKVEELEKLLDTKFLKSRYNPDVIFEQVLTRKEDNKIAEAVFNINYPKKCPKEGICSSLRMEFTTKYNTKIKEVPENAPEIKSIKYYVQNLNTTVDILTFNKDKEDVKWFPCTFEVYFDYDNVNYMYILKVPYNESATRMEQVEDFLESLSY